MFEDDVWDVLNFYLELCMKIRTSSDNLIMDLGEIGQIVMFSEQIEEQFVFVGTRAPAEGDQCMIMRPKVTVRGGGAVSRALVTFYARRGKSPARRS
jgi:hypothetical protein